jgi:hypothetical protein
VNITGYSFPWDYLDDPDASTRAAALGVDVVALAANYHATRVVNPLHPTRRVTDVPSSACYVPIEPTAWHDHRLSPRASTWLEDENSFGSAQRLLADAGLAVDAWIVLTHYDNVGYEHPDLVVRNAFHEPYPYALCPQAEDVRAYCRTLVEEILRTTTCRGVVLEACGPMGLDHSGVHDKTEFANLTTTDKQLLSLCFCRACQLGFRERGVDPSELAQRVRASIGVNATSPEEALGDELANEVAKYRVGLSTGLHQVLVEPIRRVQPDVTLTLHAAADRWATGSFPAVGDATSLGDVATTVANCWDVSRAESSLRELRERVPSNVKVGGYVRVDQGWFDESVVDERIQSYVDAGMDELHLYHLGLLSRTSLVTSRQIVESFRRCGSERSVHSDDER